ncbi:MAG TPA: DUF2169 domain-containing protein [Blastocatellia bacterium]|nr:DUF2169 domain-containing protein [Blastocatellia bacterium]
MWAITNQTPYKADRTWGRNRDGIHEWIVAVKGTFEIKPDGRVELAEEQLDPLLVAEYHGEPGTSSLRYDADLVAPKPATDLVLNGTAYAPKGRPSDDFLVGMRVGPIQKYLRVRGRRWWRPGRMVLTPTAAEPITKVPIVYERAYGGSDLSDPDPKRQRLDLRNPVGRGLVAQADQPLPNFEYPNGKLEEAGPAGFGAIDSFWSPRRELSGTYDEAWQQSRYPLLPEDWDPRSLLCAPADQRPETHLRGGEPVELENLTPGGRLSFTLPKALFRFRTRIDGRTEEHRGWMATVIIEPDHPRVIIVWQSSLLVRANGDYLDETIISEKTLVR